jgi:hypothetical protein
MDSSENTLDLYIRLRFWFNDDIQLSIPFIYRNRDEYKEHFTKGIIDTDTDWIE